MCTKTVLELPTIWKVIDITHNKQLEMWYETCFQHITPWHIGISFFSAAVLRNTTYQNNSNVILEDIGEGDNALLCITTCCHLSDNGFVLGNWFFPNGTRVPGTDKQWEFYRDRGQMMVRFAPQKRWRGRDIPLWDTWCNECYPDHIHWSVLRKHWWVVNLVLLILQCR